MSAMDQASQKASRPGLLRTAAIVFAKELLDALRDRRTLAVVFPACSPAHWFWWRSQPSSPPLRRGPSGGKSLCLEASMRPL